MGFFQYGQMNEQHKNILKCWFLVLTATRRTSESVGDLPMDSKRSVNNFLFLPRGWKKIAVASNLMDRSGNRKQDIFYALPSWNLVLMWTTCWCLAYMCMKSGLLMLIHPFISSFFLSLQLSNIKNLHLQNCFNRSLMATTGGYVSFCSPQSAIFQIMS